MEGWFVPASIVVPDVAILSCGISCVATTGECILGRLVAIGSPPSNRRQI